MKTRSTISAARKAAYKILLQVERGSSHSDDLLRGREIDALSKPDRHLATALVLGVLRRQIELDHKLQAFLNKPNAKVDAEVMIALRLGAFQLLHMDRIPARAAIDESVELAKQAGHKFASGMVNAVLRKVAAAPHIDPAEENAADLALSRSYPQWLVERWVENFGLETARSICRHGLEQPAQTIRLAGPEVEAELMREGVQLEVGELLACARAVLSGDVAASAAFAEGRVRFPGAKSIVDCCAAPGGKTLILAERCANATIVACEASASRMTDLQARLSGLGKRMEYRQGDFVELANGAANDFDLALVDAPCSGTGTLGRNPEIRHRLRIEDLTRQAERQRALLRAALRSVRPGGSVVFSTCSLEPEENEQVVAAVLAETPNAKIQSLAPRIEELRAAGILTSSGSERLLDLRTPEGALRLLPGVLGTDGFFVACVERLPQEQRSQVPESGPGVPRP
jgi:16S rRNA (cytosine967-C5)-methyltransferase